MKKLMLVAAATSIAALRPAVLSADGVSSANVVGYNTVTVAAGKWYMLAPQFEAIGNEASATADLLEIMTVTGVTAETWANRASASQIQVLNPSSGGYTIYYYTTNGGVTGWRRTPMVATELPVSYGSGVWLKVVTAADGASVTLAGQVKSVESFSVNVGGDITWQIVSNPFPAAIKQANLTTTGIAAEPWANRANASQIQVLNVSTGGYNIYYYTSGNGGTFWRRTPAAPATTDEICPVGQSVWVKALTSGTLTFTL